jgi:hypothetical protein
MITNGSKRFRFEIVFENKHTFWSRIDAPAQLLRNWLEQRPSNKGNLDLSARGRLGEYYAGVDLLLI